MIMEASYSTFYVNNHWLEIFPRGEVIKMASSNQAVGAGIAPTMLFELFGEIIHPWERVRAALSPVTWGFGVPPGDGSAVVLIPGFLGTDSYLIDMYWWLWRIGYKPYMSQIGINVRCPDLLCDRLTETVRRAYFETGRKVYLIGHSLGGTLALTVAVRNPGVVAGVITLGAPLRPVDGRISLNLFTFAVVRVASPRIDVRVEGCHTALTSNPQARLEIAYALSQNGTQERAVA
jgi:pimeloyl-ACP methyl ester carboxylesterase